MIGGDVLFLLDLGSRLREDVNVRIVNRGDSMRRIVKRIVLATPRLAALFLVAAVLAVFAPGCGGDDEYTADGQKIVKLKLGHIVKPGSPIFDAAEKLAADVKARTGGAVVITIYGSSQLGNQADLIEGLQIGAVDMTISSPAVMSALTPEIAVLDLPYIFPNAKQAYAVLDGDIGQELYASSRRDHGYTVLSVWENGFRHTTNSKREITSPEDMAGLKIRVPESQIYLEMMKALGANPTPMEFGELFTALQTGAVDGQENPISQTYSSRFYEIQSYMTLDGHIYATQPVLIRNASLEKLSPEQREILFAACNEARDWERGMVAQREKGMMEEMEKAGMRITPLTVDQIAKFQAAVAPVWAIFEKAIGKEMLDKVANYRLHEETE